MDETTSLHDPWPRNVNELRIRYVIISSSTGSVHTIFSMGQQKAWRTSCVQNKTNDQVCGSNLALCNQSFMCQSEKDPDLNLCSTDCSKKPKLCLPIPCTNVSKCCGCRRFTHDVWHHNVNRYCCDRQTQEAKQCSLAVLNRKAVILPALLFLHIADSGHKRFPVVRQAPDQRRSALVANVTRRTTLSTAPNPVRQCRSRWKLFLRFLYYHTHP